MAKEVSQKNGLPMWASSMIGTTAADIVSFYTCVLKSNNGTNIYYFVTVQDYGFLMLLASPSIKLHIVKPGAIQHPTIPWSHFIPKSKVPEFVYSSKVQKGLTD